MIPLAILCAVLSAIAWRFWSLFGSADRMRTRFLEGLHNQIRSDSILIAEAYALLHDERHKGRLENQKAWQAARDEWSAKVKGVKA